MYVCLNKISHPNIFYPILNYLLWTCAWLEISKLSCHSFLSSSSSCLSFISVSRSQSATAGGMALCHYLFLSSHSWSFWSLSMPEGTRMLWFKSRCLVVMRQITKRFCLLLTCLNFWQIYQCPLWRALRGRSLRIYAGDWAFLRAGLYRRKGKLGTTAYSLIIADLVANVRFLKSFFHFTFGANFADSPE